MDFIESQSEEFPWHYRPFTKADPPEVSSVTFSNSEGVTSEDSTGEDSLELTQHVTKYEAQLGQVPSVVGVLVKKLLLACKENWMNTKL